MSLTWSETKKELLDFKRDIVVSASAGTGKTTALVELFCKLLDPNQPCPIDGIEQLKAENILAITFTNNAASQMRAKVSERLSEVPFGDGISLEERLQGAYILTFHSLCKRLLEDYAFEIGLPPDFEVADDFEQKRLQQESVRETLEQAIRKQDPDAMLLVNRRLFSDAVAGIQKLLYQRHGKPIPPINIGEERGRLTSKLVAISKEIDEAIHIYKTADPKSDKITDILNRWTNHSEFENPITSKTPKEIVLPFLQQLSETTKGGWGKKILAPQRKSVQKAVKELSDCFMDVLAIPERAAFAEIGERCRLLFQDKKATANLLDYDDLQNFALNLLSNNRHAREEVQRQFHVVMVDEAQDTNQTQIELLYSYIRRDKQIAAQTGLPPTRFLLVGDRKQSIYRFRGADVAVFRDMEKRATETGGQCLHFDDNYRSRPALLSFFNDVFQAVMAPSGNVQPFETAYLASDDLVPGLPTATQETSHPIQFLDLVVDESVEKPNMENLRRGEARILAERISKWLEDSRYLNLTDTFAEKGISPGDIAILIRSRTHATAYEKALRERDIPYVITKSTGYFERQEIRDILNAITFITQPQNTVSRLAFLRSPSVSLSEDSLLALFDFGNDLWENDDLDNKMWQAAFKRIPEEESNRLKRGMTMISRLRKREAYLPVSEAIELLIDKLDLWNTAYCVEDANRIHANITKLINLAREWEQSLPGFSLSTFLNRIDALAKITPRESESPPVGTESAVQIMTIHQAKGLEFPIVILPGLDAASNQASRDQLAVGRDGKIAVNPIDPQTNDKIETAGLAAVKQRGKEEEDAEHQRILYVAMTRAKEFLLLSGGDTTKTAPKDSWMAWMREFATREGYADIREEVDISPYLTTPIGTHYERPVSEFSDWLEASKKLPAPPKPPAKDIIGTYSVSQIVELFKCKRRFLLNRMLSGSTLMWTESEPDEMPSPETDPDPRAKGILVHGFFESLETGTKATPQSWKDFLKKYGFSPDADWARELEAAVVKTGQFPDFAPKIVMTLSEQAFIGVLKLSASSGIRVKGRIDGLGFAKNGACMIVDYKASHYNTAKFDLHAKQLMVYAAIIRRLYKESVPISAAVGYVLDKNPWRAVATDDETLDAFLLDIEKNLLALEEDPALEQLPIGTVDDCSEGNCPYLSVCHAGEHGELLEGDAVLK